MNLSNLLFNTIANKLSPKVSLVQEERLYVKNLLNQIELLKKTKENNYKNANLKFEKSKQNLVITYIINVSFSKANTTLHVSDIKGNVKLFYSAGSVGLVGKQKKKRRIAISKLITLLSQKAPFLKGKQVALHLKNVNFYHNLIVEKLQQKFYIRVIKSFSQLPYNGCRKRKIRRKKYTQKFK